MLLNQWKLISKGLPKQAHVNRPKIHRLLKLNRQCYLGERG